MITQKGVPDYKLLVVLREIRRQGRPTPPEIATQLPIPLSSVERALQILEESGVIRIFVRHHPSRNLVSIPMKRRRSANTCHGVNKAR